MDTRRSRLPSARGGPTCRTVIRKREWQWRCLPLHHGLSQQVCGARGLAVGVRSHGGRVAGRMGFVDVGRGEGRDNARGFVAEVMAGSDRLRRAIGCARD
jgi:hypothetical protein